MLNQLFRALDPASQLTVKRIGVTVAVATVLALFSSPDSRLSFFVGLCGLAVFVSGILAMRAKQKFNATTLNHWDETAFFALITVVSLPFVSA
jgi:hypothetical protein